MLAFGFVVGLVFPFLTKGLLGYEAAASVPFVLMSIIAGFAVGLFNFFLFRVLVSRELGRIAQGMQDINKDMTRVLYEDVESTDAHLLKINSDDKIGEVVGAFNSMSRAIDERIALERNLRELMATLSNSVDLERMSHTIVKAIVETSDTEGGAVLYASLGNELELLASSEGMDKDFLPTSIKQGDDPTSASLTSGKLLILYPERDGREWAAIFTQAANSCPELVLLIPLVEESRTIGLIVLAFHRSYLTPRHRKMLELFRTYVSPYLQNALLHRRIQEIAAEDSLTGILNRRFGLRRLMEEFSLSVRHNAPISVILLDIDHFKEVNDSFGHAAGDTVLRCVASLLEENIRIGEVVCRYGGEEFLIIVPAGDSYETGKLAERLRQLVETNVVSWSGHELNVTVSLGVAMWPDGRASSAEELVNTADEALYFAKRSGRNMVAISRYGEIVRYEESAVE